MSDPSTNKQSRRQFIQKTIAATSAVALGEQLLAETSDYSATGVPTRPLGNTGERVSIICMGGWHIRAIRDTNEAIKLLHRSVDEGITFMDNAWDYHDGGSEELMGQAFYKNGYREKIFLMTKNCDRDYQGSLDRLDESLKRLKTDYIDLWQFHEMCYDNDPDWVFEKGGLRAALEAQKAGKVRYIGFTGHKSPHIHLKMLAKPYNWATAQMPINVMDGHYRSFQNEVVPVCLKQNVGVIGMKSLGGGSPGIIPSNTDISAVDCINYALSQPISSLVCGMRSTRDFEQNLKIARNYKEMAKASQEALLEQTKDLAGDGRFERFKSTTAFDGPYHRKQHGFG